MAYTILEISTHKDTGYLYVLADFGSVKEEFIMQVPPTETHIVKDKNGNWQLASGKFVPPPSEDEPFSPKDWAYETVDVDVKSVILANLDRFEAHNVGKLSGDLTAKGAGAIQKDKSDPHGFLAKPEIQALVSKSTDRVKK